MDSGSYHGPLHTDHYGRTVPRPAHGTASLPSPTSCGSRIMAAVLELFDRIVDPSLLVRRITITANRVSGEDCTQLDLFSTPEELEKEKHLRQALLEIRKKYGKNAVLRGTSLQQGATAIERHGQIGGHRA